jgi:hypothetical protein
VGEGVDKEGYPGEGIEGACWVMRGPWPKVRNHNNKKHQNKRTPTDKPNEHTKKNRANPQTRIKQNTIHQQITNTSTNTSRGHYLGHNLGHNLGHHKQQKDV